MATKRYHSSKRKSSVAGYRELEMYAGPALRDRQEYDASMMIREDHGAIANLPQGVLIREYPKTAYNNSDVPDTMVGIDYQIREDSKHEKKGKFPEKY